MTRIAVLGMALLAPFAGVAHDARPVAVEVRQAGDFGVSVSVKAPGTLDPRFRPGVRLPGECARTVGMPPAGLDGAYVYRHIYQCRESLGGRSVGLEYPYGNPSLSSLFLVTLPNGELHSKLLAPGDASWRVPEEVSAVSVLGDYTALGIRHIWLGFDHLLFVLCLLFVARTAWRILAAITGFTLAHSITLALATLGYVDVSVRAVEAIIALSIAFLAAEILRNNRHSIAWRRPMAIAVGFGLLHGLGFASVLADLGLPQLHRANALMSFNLGVEIGQILFIGMAIPGMRLVEGLGARLAKHKLAKYPFAPAARLAPVYATGIAGSWWFVERSLA